MAIRARQLLTYFFRALLVLLVVVVLFAVVAWIAWFVQPSTEKSSYGGGYTLEITDVSQANSAELIEIHERTVKSLSELREAWNLPSVSVAVAVNGEVVMNYAEGYESVADNTQATVTTLYRVGSIAKSMTGLLAAKLSQNEYVDLDTEVSTLVDEFPKKRWPITLRQLADHTGGIRHYRQPNEEGYIAEQFGDTHFETTHDALVLFQNDALLFKPGSNIQYSTFGFTLFSAGLSSATNKPFLELMRDELWQPLNMPLTQPDDFQKTVDARAVPYTDIGGRLIHIEGANPSYKWAGGGMLSTPTELVNMSTALMTDGYLSSESKAALFTPKSLENGEAHPWNYALGWHHHYSDKVLVDEKPVRVMYHGGSSPGGSSFLLVLPEQKISVAIMTNLTLQDKGYRDMAYEIAADYLSVPNL